MNLRLFHSGRVAVVGAVFAIGILGTPVRAEWVTATFANVNPGEVVTIRVNGNTETGWAGVYNFTNASGALTGSFPSFCIDISQDIFQKQTVTFDVATLESAPVDRNQVAAMGALRANLIRELWYNDFALIGTSNSKAAAFQIAIWEIINEKNTNADGTLALNINSGDFSVTAKDAATLTTANSWLSQLDLKGNGPMADNLIALTNSTYQDYVVQAAPAPSGLVLGITGVIGLLFFPALRLSKRFYYAFGEWAR